MNFLLLLMFSLNIIASDSAHTVADTLKDVNKPIVKGSKHSEVIKVNEPSIPHEGKKKLNHWSYEGDHGPLVWGKLSSDYSRCESGKKQSPINLVPPFLQVSQDIHFKYRGNSFEIFNNGHALQVDLPLGNEWRINDEKYQLLQIHFHSPSEHLLDGQLKPLEIHLVHKSADGKLAVIGILVSEGEEHAFIQSLLNESRKISEGNKKIKGDLLFNPLQLFPDDRTNYQYEGSLTTPPCSEGVKWFVFSTPIQLSVKQIDEFKKFYSNNARPLQNLNHRKVNIIHK